VATNDHLLLIIPSDSNTIYDREIVKFRRRPLAGTAKGSQKAVACLKHLGTGVSPQCANFTPGGLHLRFVLEEAALEQVSLQVSSYFPRYSSIHHCFTLICDHSTMYTISLTMQHIITSSILKLGASSLT
jgi:hypothetical protein